MHCAILLSLLSSTLLVSAARFPKRNALAPVASTVSTNKGPCVATLKNKDGHNAQHGRRVPVWEARDFGWHAAFPPNATGSSQATLFTGDNCIVIVYINLSRCELDGTRFNTSLSGKELHWSTFKNSTKFYTTRHLDKLPTTKPGSSPPTIVTGQPVVQGSGPEMSGDTPTEAGSKDNTTQSTTPSSNSGNGDDDPHNLIGPVYWKKGCSKGMKVHVDF